MTDPTPTWALDPDALTPETMLTPGAVTVRATTPGGAHVTAQVPWPDTDDDVELHPHDLAVEALKAAGVGLPGITDGEADAP